MFYYTSRFNQDLCNWGNSIGAAAAVTGIFTATACPTKSNPVLTAFPKGPFCYVCPPPPTQSPTPAPTVPTNAFQTTAELSTAIGSGAYTAGTSPYGAIETWDVSRYG